MEDEDTYNYRSSLLPILLRCHALSLFEIPVERGGLGEAEAVGDFVDAQGGMFQQHLGLHDGRAVQPVHDAVARLLAHDGTQMVGGECQSLGIECDAAMGHAIVTEQGEKTGEHLLAT